MRRIQQALIDVQQITGNTYDLGSTGPNKDGVDGDYGPKTAAAVRKFKADENLGFTQFGDVGPRTMHRLDELFSAKAEQPVQPPLLKPRPGRVPSVIELPGGLQILVPELGQTPAEVPVSKIPFPPVFGQEKAKKSPADVCADPPCGLPYVEIKPGLFVSLCNATLTTKRPTIRMIGCAPGRQGNIGFFAGQPAWQLDGGMNICGPLDKSIEVGFIQTVAAAVNMTVYRDPKTGALTTGTRECVVGARDCLGGAPAPWFDTPGNNFGPRKLGTVSPLLVDTPNIPQIKSRESGKGMLQNIFFLGGFNVWLIARLPSGKIVFIHNWPIQLFARAMLGPNADPCNISQWTVDGGANDAGNGPGAGSASPVLVGSCARTLAKPC